MTCKCERELADESLAKEARHFLERFKAHAWELEKRGYSVSTVKPERKFPEPPELYYVPARAWGYEIEISKRVTI
jgi:hypothetical protein